MARIAIDENGEGTLILWNEVTDPEWPLAEASVSVSDSAWPTWYQPPLTKISEESCFAEDWYSGYGMAVPTLSRYADGYTYIPLDSPATSIRLVDDAGNGKIFDFSQFVTPKDADRSNPFSDYTEESILYALEDQGGSST